MWQGFYGCIAMNNLVLQKLLHGHQLIQPNAPIKVMRKFGECFLPAPNYKQTEGLKPSGDKGARLEGFSEDMALNFTQVGETAYEKTESISKLPREVVYQEHKKFAKQVSQAAKFYLDISTDDGLTEKEHATIEKELVYYSPYKSVFLQVETECSINNILIYDHTEEYEEAVDEYKREQRPSFFKRLFTKKEKLADGVYDLFETHDEIQSCFSFQMLLWDKIHKHFIWDLNQYTIYFSNNDVIDDTKLHYKIQLADSPLTQYLVGENDHLKENHELTKSWIMEIIHRFRYFMIALQHPTIIDEKDIAGRQDIFIDTPTKFTTSALSAKPKFAHKNLCINLYGNNPANGNCATSRSAGTAFHSVRKHMRRLPSGKHTFVRAHFRGSKDIGLITKDYEVVTSKRSAK